MPPIAIPWVRRGRARVPGYRCKFLGRRVIEYRLFCMNILYHLKAFAYISDTKYRFVWLHTMTSLKRKSRFSRLKRLKSITKLKANRYISFFLWKNAAINFLLFKKNCSEVPLDLVRSNKNEFSYFSILKKNIFKYKTCFYMSKVFAIYWGTNSKFYETKKIFVEILSGPEYGNL